jgi:hypothetical protein
VSTRAQILRAAALAVPLFFAVGCDDDDDNGGPSGETLLVAASMGAQNQTVVLTNGGAVEDGATVTVNGTAATEAPAGTYNVTLAAPVVAGDALTLDVTSGTASIDGAGTLPESAVITAPANAAVIASGGEVVVTWTAATDPDRWVVDATGPTVESYDVADGAARTFTIAAGELADADWVIRVRAYNDADLVGDLEAGSSMAIVADPVATPTITVGTPLLLITGGDMGPEFNHVGLTLGGLSVDGATVTVNGEAALQAAPGDQYHVTLAAPVAVGDPLDLDVTVGADVYQGLGNVPEPPVVTAPADAAVFVVADAIQVDWTSTADPDRFAIFVDGPTDFQNLEIAGNLRTFTIPGGTFTAGAYTISVFSYEDGVFTGVAVDATSRMSIRGEQGPFPAITIN